MMIWDKHKDFSPEFLAKHHDYILYDVFHHIKAFLLYPLNCSCEGHCRCATLREKIILSLNVDLYNQAQERQDHPDHLYAMKLLFNLPDESYFRRHYGEA